MMSLVCCTLEFNTRLKEIFSELKKKKVNPNKKSSEKKFLLTGNRSTYLIVYYGAFLEILFMMVFVLPCLFGFFFLPKIFCGVKVK